MTKRSAKSFTAFCSEVLRVRLTRAQRVLCLVAFDGVEPKDLTGNERDLARQIFGDVDVVPPLARAVLAALVGARAGKTYLLGALRGLHLALTVPLDSLAPGEQAFVVIVAPDLRLARQALRYVSGAAKSAPSIARLISADTTETLSLVRPDGKTVTIECLPATRGGSAVRGRSLIAAILDEACFFRDEDYSVNDVEIFKAVAPRILPQGQLIIASTPWAEAGLLFELFERNHNHPVDALSACAPTLLLRDDEHTQKLVERERQRDPDNARREFDAIPMAAGTVNFFDPLAIKGCIDEELPLVLPLSRSYSYEPAFCGLDTGFRKDPSAAAIVRSTRHPSERINLCEVVELRPAKGERLVPSQTIKTLLEHASTHKCSSAVADQHYIETVREHAGSFHLVEAPGGLQGKLECYIAARTAINEGRVRIPGGNTRLIQQLRDVVSKPTSGGNLTISSPRRGGSHGDVASAFVLAVWAAARGRATGVPQVLRGGPGLTGELTEPANPFHRSYGGDGSPATHDWRTGARLPRARRSRIFD